MDNIAILQRYIEQTSWKEGPCGDLDPSTILDDILLFCPVQCVRLNVGNVHISLIYDMYEIYVPYRTITAALVASFTPSIYGKQIHWVYDDLDDEDTTISFDPALQFIDGLVFFINGAPTEAWTFRPTTPVEWPPIMQRSDRIIIIRRLLTNIPAELQVHLADMLDVFRYFPRKK